jgi:phage baseplate assembly protein gpV
LFVADSYNNRLQKFDAFTLTAGQSVLVRHQTTTWVENNIYTVTNPGGPSTPWVLTLREDADTGFLKRQSLVLAQVEGATQNRVFVLTFPVADDPVIWTHGLEWGKFEPGGPPSLHASNHQPGATDPIPTASASTITGSNSEGSALTFARADHNHEVNLPGCRVYSSSNVSVANASSTAITFNQERYDPYGMHSTSSNTSRVTVPKDGVYLITGNIRTASNSTGVRDLMIVVDGSTTIAFNGLKANATDGDLAIMQVSTMYKLTASQYVELRLWQNSGAALNVEAWGNYSPEFSVQYMGAG